MSISVNFYTFSKKANSTAQPTGTGTVYNCVFLDGADVLQPTIKLNVGMSASVTAFNYCYISDFHRYYFIQRWFFDGGLWHCILSVDPLASWKTDIGSHTGYVLRSASASNGDIKDTFYPGKSNPVKTLGSVPLSIQGQTDWADYLENGNYVVGIIGPAGNGNISYYAMTQSEFDTFCNRLYTNQNDWVHSANITDITPELLKVLFDPFIYVTSVMWFPTSIPSAGPADIYLGWWDIGLSGTLAGVSACPILHYSFTPIQHPQAATRGNYLNCAPYTSITLDFQPWGLIPLDASLVCGNSVDISMVIDFVTGAACLRIFATGPNSTQTCIYSSNAQVGVPIQIAGRQPSIGSMISGAAGMVMETSGVINAVLGQTAPIGSTLFNIFNKGESASKAAAGIANQLSEGFKKVSSTGSNGGRAYLDPYFYVSQEFVLVTDEDNAQFGRPLCEVRQISSLSGYILMGDADIQMAALPEEIDAVNGHMVRGFFYE